MSVPEPQMLLRAGDLVEDREVADVGGDRLSHAQIAAQLAELVRTVPAPSNVALYGSWGSGKSGIGNLLREELAGEKKIRFARFDAFKYAETPLRRNFVSAVASELGIEDDTFHSALYSGHTRTDVKVPANKIVRILGAFAVLTLGLSAILVGVVAVIAALQKGPYGADFSSLCKTAVTASLVPAALLSALITLANKTLQVDRSVGKPDSDEQFEQIFKDLVTSSKTDRLVIFVDELDRCAAAEVVATLDAIRTFLGVPHCVFVIAADQRVLEESLTRSARQETPADEVNPYYSTGSAYLDKVFQYQVSLPPLMSQRITRFAADLVKDRGGLWAEINSDYVVSVLVPTHVASPRRVKHLLNAFALRYRLAQDRHRRGLLADDPCENAALVAKLVCLRVEFPLFAQDLEIDPRLPEMVLHLVSDMGAEFDGTYPEHAVERARAYATENAAPASMIADAQDKADSGEIAQVGAQSNRQLLDYLRRTKTVRGPIRDLVFLHSTGTAFGLDGQTALAIEAAAENADSAAVARRLDDADPATQQGVLQLLNHLIRTGLGVGGQNAARTLLGVCNADQTLPVDAIADSASEMIAVLAETDPDLLDGETVEPAWWLAGHGSEAGALQLQDAILAKADAIGQSLDASFVLRNPGPALAGREDVFDRLVARELVRKGGEESVLLLSDLDDATARDVLRASSTVSTALQAAIDAHRTAAEIAAAPPSPAPYGRTVGTPPPEPEDEFDPEPIVRALARYASEHMGESPSLAHQVILTLLRVDRKQCRDAVETLLGEGEPAEDAEIVEAVLAGTRKRALTLWPQWFAGIAPSAVASRHSETVGKLAAELWVSACGEDADRAAVRAAVAALNNIVDQLPDVLRPDLTADAVETVAEAVTDEAEAEARSRLLGIAQPFGTAGLIDMTRVYRAALPTLPVTLATSIGGEISTDSALARYLSRDAVDIVRIGTPGNEDGPEQVKATLAQLTNCTWLPEPLSTELLLRLMSESGVPAADLGALPSADDITGLIEKHSQAAANTVAEWIRLAHPDGATITPVFAALQESRTLTEPIVSAVEKVRRGWSKEQKADFLRNQISDPDSSAPTSTEARLIGLHDVDASDITDVIVERFGNCTNNTQRKAIVGVVTAASITDTASRKRLIESIVILMLKPPDGRPQAGMTEIGLDALARIGAPLPHGVKRALGEAVKGAVSGNSNLEKKAVKVLGPLGYQIESSGWLSRRRSVKYSN